MYVIVSGPHCRINQVVKYLLLAARLRLNPKYCCVNGMSRLLFFFFVYRGYEIGAVKLISLAASLSHRFYISTRPSPKSGLEWLIYAALCQEDPYVAPRQLWPDGYKIIQTFLFLWIMWAEPKEGENFSGRP